MTTQQTGVVLKLAQNAPGHFGATPCPCPRTPGSSRQPMVAAQLPAPRSHLKMEQPGPIFIPSLMVAIGPLPPPPAQGGTMSSIIPHR